MLTLANRGGGKCLKEDTKVPTPEGFKEIRDLKVGDYVYSDKGDTVPITYHSGILSKPNSYKVTFDNGQEVFTDGEHLWKVQDLRQRRLVSGRKTYAKSDRNKLSGRTPHNKDYSKLSRLVSTEDMLREGLTVGKETNFSIDLPSPVFNTEKEYEIHPYVLGYWLGDGTTVTGTITIGKDDRDEAISNFESCGEIVSGIESSDITFRLFNLTSRLKMYGLCESEKFIPNEYLQGSVSQRLELLQGLLDSDGGVETGGKICFSSSIGNLADQVYSLASSLGFKVSRTTKVPKFNGKIGKVSHILHIGKKLDTIPFKLHRKVDRYKDACAHYSPVNSRYFVKSIEKVEDFKVCCIRVESEDHIFLCSESFIPTHNTFGQAQVTFLRNTFHDNYDVITSAAILNQSNVSKGYLANFYEDPVLREGFLKAPTATSAVWKTNSKWSIATGSMKGISGQHPVQLNIDEVEFWTMDAIEQTYAVPQDKNGYRKVWAAFSTRQRSFGAMNQLVNRASEPGSGLKLYQWNIFETMHRCPTCLCIKGGQVVSNPHEKCFLWEDCKGEKARKSSGWFKREDAEQMKKNMTTEAWATQYLCSKPSTHGLVMYNFEHKFATASNFDNGNYMALEQDNEFPLYMVHDPAESKTSFALFFHIFDGKMIIVDELVDDNCYTVDKVKVALEEHLAKKRYQDPKFVIVDPHRTDAGKQWEEGRYLGTGRDKKYHVVYPDMSVNELSRIEPGLELVRTLVCNGSGTRRIFVNPNTCPRLTECIREHHYKIGADNKLMDDAIPSKEFKDGIDALRYAVIWAVQRGLLSGSGTSHFSII